MTVGREQIRRDEMFSRWERYKHAMLATEQSPRDYPTWLESELEQAERKIESERKARHALEQALDRSESERKNALRERDETWVSLCRSKETELRLEAQLAKVPALVEAAKALSHFLEEEKETREPPTALLDQGYVALETSADYEREEQLSIALVHALAAWEKP